MKKIISFLSCLFIFNCFVFAGDEVVYSYFYPNLGVGSFISDDDFPVIVDPAYPVVVDPNWPSTLSPDFPKTEEPEFPEAEVKPVKDVLKEEAENAMKAEKEHFKIALEKLMKQNLFDFDSDVIKEENFDNLDAIAEFLKEYDNIKVEIEGHTDNVGTEEYNKGLSERRAKAVGDYLINKGIDSSRITTEGFGFSKPAASNDTEEGQAQNRRTEMVFKLKDISSAITPENQTIQEKAVQEVLEEETTKEAANVQETIKEEAETKEEELSDLERTLNKEIETGKEEISNAQEAVKEEAEIKEEELSSDLERALNKEIETGKEEISNAQEAVKEEAETKEEELSSDLERALNKEIETGKEEISNAQEAVKEEVETKEEELSDLEKALRKNAEAEKEEAANVQETIKEEVETKEEELSDLEKALRKNAEAEKKEDVNILQQALKQEIETAIGENKDNFSISLEKFSKASLFEFGSATIMEENFANLDAIAEFLKENDKIAVKIEGHTDNIGSEGYNKNLSERRAKSVGDYLIKKGIDSSRITTEGLGFSKPIASNDTEEGQAQNRRTEIIFKIQK